jgi:hypothetical protein
VAGRATGHNFQFFTAATAPGGAGRLVHVETRPPALSFVQEVTRGRAQFHANCYEQLRADGSVVPPSPGLPGIDGSFRCIADDTFSADSAARMARAGVLWRESGGAPASTGGVLGVLGDVQNASEYPIYADPRTPTVDDRQTINSAVFDLRTGEVAILSGNPRLRQECSRSKFGPGL